MDSVFSLIPNISLETANKFYTFGWAASIGGAAITFVAVMFLMWGTRVRDHDFEDNIRKLNDRAITSEKQRKQDEDTRKAQVGVLQKQLSEANNKLAEIDRLRAPRHVSDEEKKKITNFITTNSKGSGFFIIKATTSADDARPYADEIATLFNAPPINWRVIVDNAIITGADVSGLWITIKDPNAIPPATGLLHAALTDAGLPIRKNVEVDPKMASPDEIWLQIGIKR